MPEPQPVDNGDLTDYNVLVDDVTDATLGTGAKQLVGLTDATIGATTKVAAGGGVEANALRVTLASDSTGLVSVDDNGGSLTVDGTVSVSGTVAVDSELTTADLDTGAGTDTRAVVGLVKAASGGGVLVSDANPLPISDAGSTVSVDDGAGSLTVDGTVTANLAAGTNNIGDVDVLTVPAPLSTTGGGTEAAALRVTLANDSTGLVSVDDNGGSLTVDGTVGVSGTVTVDSELTTADLDTGAGTDTRAVVGLALAASGGALLVGAANPVPVSDNGSTLSIDDGAGSITVDGTVTTSPSGDHTVVGKAADGAAVSGNPVLIAGQDGTNVQSLKTDASGELQVDVLTLPALVAGTANIGDVDVLTVPAPLSTTGGGTEATALRVTVASDSTGVLSVDDNGGSLTVDGTVTVTDGLNIEGDVAHDGADSGNPVKQGAKAVAHGSNPTAVAAADRTDLYANRHGIQFTIGGHPNAFTSTYNTTAAQTDDNILAAIATGNKYAITRITVTLDEATTVGVTVRIGFGATTVPALGASGADAVAGILLYHPGLVPGGGLTIGDGSGILGVGGDGEELRITCDAPTSGSLGVTVTGFQIES